MDAHDKKTLGVGLLTTSGVALFYGLDPEYFLKFFGAALNNQIAQAGIAFTFAAWIHSGRVKKEISSQFTYVTEAINNVATALRQDLAAHAVQISEIKDGFIELNIRVEYLEKQKEK